MLYTLILYLLIFQMSPPQNYPIKLINFMLQYYVLIFWLLCKIEKLSYSPFSPFTPFLFTLLNGELEKTVFLPEG